MDFNLKTKKIISNDKGFTLIEMAVVLIIIGLIIGAVVKGKDIVTSAQQKKIYTKFVQSWQIAFNSYYDRTGWILGDDASGDNTGARNGFCDGSPTCANVVAQLRAVGLEPPIQGASGSECVRNYNDSQDRSYALTINFRYDADIGNYIEISDTTNGMPSELGMAWDNIVDGERGGDKGDFQYHADGTTITASSAAPWPAVDAAAVPASVGIFKLQF